MATKKTYLFAVQRPSGHEVVSATIETAKVSEVEAQLLDDGTVRLIHAGDVVAVGTSVVDPTEALSFLRWVKSDKLGEPVVKPVKKTSETE